MILKTDRTYRTEEETTGVQLYMYRPDGKACVRLNGYSKFAQLFLENQDAKVKLDAGPGSLIAPSPYAELSLTAQDVRAQMVACDGAPHVVLYDQKHIGRLHMTLNQKGRPRILKYFWRWLAPLWSHVSIWPVRVE